MKRAETIKGCCLPPSDSAGAGATPEHLAVQGTGQAGAAQIALDGGWFRMGADDAPHPEDGEGPARDVFVDAFSLAATAVTIAEFGDFVNATGYRTLAERMGSSFVFYAFVAADSTYSAPAQAPWWRQVPGAFWRDPDGPGSEIGHRLNHPVTHIAREDALAYCHWSGTRLPTEAEWEYAARGGFEARAFPWGDELEPDGTHLSNVWQGDFPHNNNAADGFKGTAPAMSFPANGYGLFNMTGNVWEWVSDRFTNLFSPRPVRNPKGPLNGQYYVARGGSYLCHASYCARYRTSSRQSLRPDTTTGNLGFRVALPKSETGQASD